jgi:S1-C subfamily serine protease
MINGKSELMEVIGQHNPGDKIAVTISRNGTDINVPPTFLSENEDKGMIRENRIIIHGATFEPITDAEKSKFRISSGFKITRLENGKLKNAGIRPGFILISVDRKVIGTAQELKDALTSRDGGVLIEGIYPNGLRAYYGIGL